MISALPWLAVAFAFWAIVWITIDSAYDYIMAVIERWRRAHRRSHR